MKRMKASQLFLMELLIDLIFFCVCVAVCVTLWLHAQTLSVESERLGSASLAAQNAAAAYQATQGELAQTAALLRGTAENGVLQQQFDAHWSVCDEDGAFVLTISPQAGDTAHTAAIEVRQRDGQLIFSLSVAAVIEEVAA